MKKDNNVLVPQSHKFLIPMVILVVTNVRCKHQNLRICKEDTKC